MLKSVGQFIPGRKTIRIFGFLLILGAVSVTIYYHREMVLLWEAVKNGETPSTYVIAAFLILPVFGFPILPLLVLMGLRFGSVAGLLILFSIIPIHLTISFWVTRNMLREPFEKIIEARSINIPVIPDDSRLKYSMIFMAVPGLSYSLKNYILPLSGLSFMPFIFCGWLTQGVLGTPFVVAGGSLSQSHIYIFAVIAGLYLVMLIFKSRITSVYDRIFRNRQKENTKKE